MFAIIKDGAKQYRVSAGGRILVDRMESPAGQDVEFKEVLLISGDGKVAVGKPCIKNAVVRGVIEGEERGEKLFPLKKKRRKSYRRRIGHRQTMSAVRIKEICIL